MKVLQAYALHAPNPYLEELVAPMIEMGTEVTCNVEKFWEGSDTYDIVHLQWPEHMEDYSKPNILDKVVERLQYWNERARVVITRHNEQPHFKQRVLGERLYEIVYDHVDGIIHLGNYSLQQFKETNRHLVTGKAKQHKVIPHHFYHSQQSGIDRDSARQKLGLPLDAYIILVFGSLRLPREVNWALHAYRRLSIPKKLLLIPKWKYVTPYTNTRRKRSRLEKQVVTKFNLMRYQNRSDIIAAYGDASNEEVGWFMRAANVLLVTRKQLNTGLIPIAYSNGLPTAGPAWGNMKELLEATGNPVFSVGANREMVGAIQYCLDHENELSQANLEYSNTLLSPEQVAQQHIDFYRKLLAA